MDIELIVRSRRMEMESCLARLHAHAVHLTAKVEPRCARQDTTERGNAGGRARARRCVGSNARSGCRSTIVRLSMSMTKDVTLRQAGGSVSATLPKDMADRLRLEAGDRVLAVETDKGILLTPYDPETERALKVAAKAAKQYRNALREIAT